MGKLQASQNAGVYGWVLNILMPKSPKKPEEGESKTMYYVKTVGFYIHVLLYIALILFIIFIIISGLDGA